MSDTTAQQKAFDPRLLTIGVQIRGVLKTYAATDGFYIRVKGQKFANALQNECTVEIANADTETRNYLLTETSPFNQNRTPKLLTVNAGRVSTGEFLVYAGDIMTTGITQPPDIMLKMKCGTAHSKKGSVGRRSGGKSTKLSALAAAISGNLGTSLRMETPDMLVSNYAHSGNALDEIDNLADAGNCQVYVDDNHLILKQAARPLSGPVLNLSQSTGMIGIPEINEQGLKVRFLFSSLAKLGGGLQITSVLNPAANGLFVIYKLGFELSSRETEFYYTAECLKAAS